MKKIIFYSLLCLLFTAGFCRAEQGLLDKLPGASDIPLEKYDTTAIVEIPNMSPSADKTAGVFTEQNAPQGSAGGAQSTTDLPPVQDPQAAALQTPVNNALATPQAQEALELAQREIPQKSDKKTKSGFGLKLSGEQKEEDEISIPEGTLAVYIDIEEAFNNNPWTIKARKNIKIDLETVQLEYAQMQDQLQELRNKLTELNKELEYYTPYYQNLEYISPLGDKAFPVLKEEKLENICKNLLFAPAASQVDSPLNIPLKIKQLQSAVKDTKKSIMEKEAFLVDYRELSKEEILSRQDYIVQQILKQIYSGIKEFAAVRNIGLVVDKKDLIFGKPLNVTPEFVKWMKTYNKKYTKEHGDIL